jgi:hypothetical protein
MSPQESVRLVKSILIQMIPQKCVFQTIVLATKSYKQLVNAWIVLSIAILI